MAGGLAIAAQLGASLVAVLALAWLARWFELGGDVRIESEAHARQIAFEALYGFYAVDVTIDRAGYSALLKDVQNQHALIIKLGSGFAVRQLKQPFTARLDQQFLTIDLDEPGVEPVTLNLGEEAQYWAGGMRHLPA